MFGCFCVHIKFFRFKVEAPVKLRLVNSFNLKLLPLMIFFVAKIFVMQISKLTSNPVVFLKGLFNISLNWACFMLNNITLYSTLVGNNDFCTIIKNYQSRHHHSACEIFEAELRNEMSGHHDKTEVSSCDRLWKHVVHFAGSIIVALEHLQV